MNGKVRLCRALLRSLNSSYPVDGCAGVHPRIIRETPSTPSTVSSPDQTRPDHYACVAYVRRSRRRKQPSACTKNLPGVDLAHSHYYCELRVFFEGFPGAINWWSVILPLFLLLVVHSWLIHCLKRFFFVFYFKKDFSFLSRKEYFV